jgi:hypothetical protein
MICASKRCKYDQYCLADVAYFLLPSVIDPENGGNKFHRNVRNLPDYTDLYSTLK